MEFLKWLFGIFDFEHIFTPLAIEHIKRHSGQHSFRTYRVVYVFGVRIAHISTVKHK